MIEKIETPVRTFTFSSYRCFLIILDKGLSKLNI